MQKTVVSLLLLSTTSQAWFVALNVPPGSGAQVHAMRGHEELVYLAVEMANQKLQEANMVYENGQPFYPLPQSQEFGSTATNMLVLGNFAVDDPDHVNARMQDEVMDVRKAYTERLQIPRDSNWHNHGSLQTLHFLRAFIGNTPAPAKNSCDVAKGNIDFASNRAVANWVIGHDPSRSEADRKKSRDRALFWIGVATHIIQDSFSPVHTRREATPEAKMLDLCAYNRPGLPASICKHAEIDAADDVFVFTSPLAPPGPAGTRLSALKPEAQMAVKATSEYLQRMAMSLDIGRSPIDGFLAISTTSLRVLEFFMGDHGGTNRFTCPGE